MYLAAAFLWEDGAKPNYCSFSVFLLQGPAFEKPFFCCAHFLIPGDILWGFWERKIFALKSGTVGKDGMGPKMRGESAGTLWGSCCRGFGKLWHVHSWPDTKDTASSVYFSHRQPHPCPSSECGAMVPNADGVFHSALVHRCWLFWKRQKAGGA